MESFGFKEWAIVCEALGRGEQSIILRKGGIAEGRSGFSFEHREFFLFPTYFHEQPQKVRQLDSELPSSAGDDIAIKFFSKLESAHTITSWIVAESLAPLHILQPEVVRERFESDGVSRLHVAFVRIFRIVPLWTFPNEKKYAGCRSWVKLSKPPADLRFEPVLTDAEHARRLIQFQAILDFQKAPAGASTRA